MTQADTLPESPCIQICRLDDEGICTGCLRTIDEITYWPEMDGETRRCLLDELRRRRERSMA